MLSSQKSRPERPEEKDSHVIDMKEDDNKVYINVDPVSFLSFDFFVLFVTRPWIDHYNARSIHFAIVLRNIFGVRRTALLSWSNN